MLADIRSVIRQFVTVDQIVVDDYEPAAVSKSVIDASYELLSLVVGEGNINVVIKRAAIYQIDLYVR